MTYPYEIEVMLGSEGAVSFPSLLFSSNFNPSPSSDSIKIISDSFSVTNDGGTTTKSAYSVVEIKKEDWEYLKSNYAPSQYFLMFNSLGSWVGSFYIIGSAGSCMIILSEDSPSSGDPTCSFTTMSVSVYNEGGQEIEIPSGKVTVKTYIDGQENTDSSYAPVNASMETIPAHVEGDTPIVEEWLWQSGEINVSEHSPLIFKMALVNVEPEYESIIKGIDSWSVLGTYREDPGQYNISVVKTIEGYNYGVSIPNTGSGYKTAATPILIRTNESTFESQNIGMVSVKAFNSETGEEWGEDLFLPSGGTDFSTSMTKI